ncbi:MAG: hypothetical protein SPL02_01975 [Bacilli bacterium]|nr:hypothetical protein [Bacilli bacterium]MDY6430598.1 hypothetical protein [Bacilli bacterium]
MPFLSLDILTDEGLIFRCRLGDANSRDILVRRYFFRKQTFINNLDKVFISNLDRWTLNEIFFASFLYCEEHFNFGMGKFFGYFKQVFYRNVIQACKEAMDEAVHMDSFFGKRYIDSDGEVLPSLDEFEAAKVEDPRVLLNSQESCTAGLEKLDKLLTPELKYILKLRNENTPFLEIAAELKTTVNSIKYKYYKLKRELEKIFN